MIEGLSASPTVRNKCVAESWETRLACVKAPRNTFFLHSIVAKKKQYNLITRVNKQGNGSGQIWAIKLSDDWSLTYSQFSQ